MFISLSLSICCPILEIGRKTEKGGGIAMQGEKKKKRKIANMLVPAGEADPLGVRVMIGCVIAYLIPAAIVLTEPEIMDLIGLDSFVLYIVSEWQFSEYREAVRSYGDGFATRLYYFYAASILIFGFVCVASTLAFLVFRKKYPVDAVKYKSIIENMAHASPAEKRKAFKNRKWWMLAAVLIIPPLIAFHILFWPSVDVPLSDVSFDDGARRGLMFYDLGLEVCAIILAYFTACFVMCVRCFYFIVTLYLLPGFGNRSQS